MNTREKLASALDQQSAAVGATQGESPKTAGPARASHARREGTLRESIAELWAYRELLLEFTRRDIRVRYKQAVIGIAWAVLMPLVVILSGFILRLAFGRISGEAPNDAMMAGVAVKSVGWAFFVGALGFGTASITGHLALITKTYFPRAVLPLASVLTQLLDAGIAVVALTIALPFFGVGLTGQALWLVPLAVLLILITTGVTLLASCANVFFRDAKHLVQIVLSFGIFFTPVFFAVDAFGVTGARIAMLNPLAPILEGLRLAIVDGHNLLQPLTGAAGVLVWTPAYLVYAAIWGVAGLLGSVLLFHRSQFLFAEYV